MKKSKVNLFVKSSSDLSLTSLPQKGEDYLKLNTRIDYEEFLLRLRDDFRKRWDTICSSPATGLQGFKTKSSIGCGSFGVVKIVRNVKTGKYYAVKVMNKQSIVATNQVQHTLNEKRVLQSVRFPFLTSLKFSRKDFLFLYFGMTLCSGGDLFTNQTRVDRFTERQARFFAAQVLLGLEYLHFMDLLYRDLKPENICLDHVGYLKLTDYGFVKRVSGRTVTLCGTPEYFPPEMIQTKPYGKSVDWWSFGVLIYEMVAGYSPFSDYKDEPLAMYSKICDGEYKMPSYFSSTLKSLLTELLQVDVSKRLGCAVNGASDIKNHTWFRTVDWYALLNQEIEPPFRPGISTKDATDIRRSCDRAFQKSRSRVDLFTDLFADF